MGYKFASGDFYSPRMVTEMLSLKVGNFLTASFQFLIAIATRVALLVSFLGKSELVDESDDFEMLLIKASESFNTLIAAFI